MKELIFQSSDMLKLHALTYDIIDSENILINYDNHIKMVVQKYKLVPINIGTNYKHELPENICCNFCNKTLKKYKQLQCLHLFHPQCISNWFIYKDLSCPVCKKTVL
jgi:hypothetical protein